MGRVREVREVNEYTKRRQKSKVNGGAVVPKSDYLTVPAQDMVSGRAGVHDVSFFSFSFSQNNNRCILLVGFEEVIHEDQLA